MHKREDLNLDQQPLTVNPEPDSQLVIDHKWQEIYLSLFISPFYFSMLPLWDDFTPAFHTGLEYLKSYLSCVFSKAHLKPLAVYRVTVIRGA